MSPNEIKKKLDKLGTRSIKKFGQNFLINTDLIESIVFYVKKDSLSWLEIGPGLGSLTDHFESQKQNIILVEKDKKLAAYWQNKGFKVICEDGLKLDWSQFDHKITLFGNLPYQIVGRLILELSCCQKKFNKIVFMMQKEVAARLLSAHQCKEYGILSVIAQTFWDIKSLAIANQDDFYPSPKVKGQVLQFINKNFTSIQNPKEFLNFVKICFSQRRKKLVKLLPSSLDSTGIKNLLSQMDYDENVRAEQLTPQDFVHLYKEIQQP